MKKRSVCISGHNTSISLEDEFWDEIKMIASQNDMSLNDYVSEIDQQRHQDGQIKNLSSALRLAILEYYKNKANNQEA